MDAIVIGGITGLIVSVLNTILWRYIFFHTHFAGIKLHDGIKTIIVEGINSTSPSNKLDGLVYLEKNILDLFDDFMSNKLTVKMPVLSMFIDDKLIQEIRVVFHDEMAASLPQLLQNSTGSDATEKMISGFADQIRYKVAYKFKRFAFIFVCIGTVSGACIGWVAGCLLN